MKILVLGARGMLGSMAVRVFDEMKLGTVVGWGRSELDLSTLEKPGKLDPLRRLRPDWIVNCAAYTNVDGCETDRTTAMKVNGEAPGTLAKTAKEIDAKFFHVSTDYVFNGKKMTPYTEEDPVDPKSVYGKSKLEGERRAIQAGGGSVTVVRTAWVYGPNGKNFVGTILKLASERPELSVVYDQKGCPTYTKDLAGWVAAMIRKGPDRTLYHLTNAGSCNWYEFAHAIVEEGENLGFLKKKPDVHPVTGEEFKRPAPRPANSVLDCSRFDAEFPVPRRDWYKALQEYLRLEYKKK